MNKNILIENKTKGVVVLAGKYNILPNEPFILGVIEYAPILNKINLLKAHGWIEWKFVPVDYQSEVGLTTKSVEDLTKESAHLSHTASELINPKIRTSRVGSIKKQEGEPKADDLKGTV